MFDLFFFILLGTRRSQAPGTETVPGGENKSLIHISEPTRRYATSYAGVCLKKKKANKNDNTDRTSTTHHPGAETVFTKTTKTTGHYTRFDHLYEASNPSTRQQNSAL